MLASKYQSHFDTAPLIAQVCRGTPERIPSCNFIVITAHLANHFMGISWWAFLKLNKFQEIRPCLYQYNNRICRCAWKLVWSHTAHINKLWGRQDEADLYSNPFYCRNQPISFPIYREIRREMSRWTISYSYFRNSCAKCQFAKLPFAVFNITQCLVTVKFSA